MAITAESIDEFRIIDADTHVVEPPDLWTSRVPVARWGDRVPHLRWDDERQGEFWFSGEQVIGEAMPGATLITKKFATEEAPDGLRRWEHVPPKYWRAEDRLKQMDEYGIYAQVLYPNVIGLGAGKFAIHSEEDSELSLLLVRAYNDYLTEYAQVAPDRYIPVAGLPFWDLDLSIAEMARVAELGHRGFIFSQDPRGYGQPALGDPHWDRLWAAAQEMQMPVNFHIGSGVMERQVLPVFHGKAANHTAMSVPAAQSNAQTFATLISAGVCHRFPDLRFVSVESGIGWVPFTLQAMDWYWGEFRVVEDHPEYDLLPSEYFLRQFYVTFWFERGVPLDSALEFLGPDNIMYETDYPHPTSMTPSLGSLAVPARQFVAEHLGHLPEPTLRKILHDNAARLYGLD